MQFSVKIVCLPNAWQGKNYMNVFQNYLLVMRIYKEIINQKYLVLNLYKCVQ